jgi:hypothetical membrane protein
MLPRKKWLRLAGLCGVVAPAVTLSCILLAVSWSPWFSWSANALSDLGVGEAAGVFNSGLMVGGVLTAVFAAGLWAALEKQALARAGVAVFFLAAVALFGIGLFSEAAGAIHVYFSVAFFMLLPLSLFLMGMGAVRAGSCGFGTFTILAGIIAVVPWVFPWQGVAIPEIISALAAATWGVTQGTRLYLGRV